MTSILITGAGGLIGARVAEAASKAGHDVARLVHHAAPGALARDLTRPLEDVPHCDWVFHLAGGYAGAGRQALRRSDLRIAGNLLAWGTRHGVRNWVFASAAEVYGRIGGVGDEDAPTRPTIPYGAVKLAIEKLFKKSATPGGRVVILRIGEVYGRDARLIRELAARLRRGLCPWPGSGCVPVSFVHVDDVVQAFLHALDGAPRGLSVYNVADDEPATWRAFVGRCAQTLGTPPPLFLPRPLVRLYALGHTLASLVAGRPPVLTGNAIRLLTTPKALSNRRIVTELGFKPRFAEYRSGLEETLHGLSHDTEDGRAQSGAARASA